MQMLSQSNSWEQYFGALDGPLREKLVKTYGLWGEKSQRGHIGDYVISLRTWQDQVWPSRQEIVNSENERKIILIHPSLPSPEWINVAVTVLVNLACVYSSTGSWVVDT